MKLSLLFFLFLFLFLSKANFALAIEDPLATPNNKMGIHILFTQELDNAAHLVNSNAGDWGYVTIPIQIGDKDLEKWQKFMDEAKKQHIIPIIRLAIEGDYFNAAAWKKPSDDDILDFVNFLNSLDWPVKNRYIIVFNEVNRGDEWGGIPNPKEYADILSYAVNTFKSANKDFFIISAGLDNASANIAGQSINEYDFMTEMNNEVPGIFSQIDGLGSHSYPNPGFSQPPWRVTAESTSSFSFERQMAYNLSGKTLPIFITETGWSRDRLSDTQIAAYFSYTFSSIWSDSNIVAVTPFLLQAGIGPFLQFSILNQNGEYNEISKALAAIPKTKGKPTINYGLGISSYLLPNKNIPLKTFPQKVQYNSPPEEQTKTITAFLKWLLKLSP